MSSHRENSNPPQTVLVVDNLADVRGLLGAMLGRLGYREAGFSDYLVKPFEAGELEGVLERLLPRKGAPIH